MARNWTQYEITFIVHGGHAILTVISNGKVEISLAKVLFELLLVIIGAVRAHCRFGLRLLVMKSLELRTECSYELRSPSVGWHPRTPGSAYL